MELNQAGKYISSNQNHKVLSSDDNSCDKPAFQLFTISQSSPFRSLPQSSISLLPRNWQLWLMRDDLNQTGATLSRAPRSIRWPERTWASYIDAALWTSSGRLLIELIKYQVQNLPSSINGQQLHVSPGLANNPQGQCRKWGEPCVFALRFFSLLRVLRLAFLRNSIWHHTKSYNKI